MTPPTARTGPVQVIPGDVIRINATYAIADNAEFIKTISRYDMFPVTPLGMCYDGSQKLDSTYRGFGHNVKFLYDPSEFPPRAISGLPWGTKTIPMPGLLLIAIMGL
jgi:hypothetical protein